MLKNSFTYTEILRYIHSHTLMHSLLYTNMLKRSFNHMTMLTNSLRDTNTLRCSQTHSLLHTHLHTQNQEHGSDIYLHKNMLMLIMKLKLLITNRYMNSHSHAHILFTLI